MNDYLDLEKLKTIWRKFLDVKIKELRDTKNITPTFHIVSGCEKADIVMGIAPEMMGSEDTKDALAQLIRKAVADVKAQAVMSITDTFQADFRGRNEEVSRECSRRMVREGITVSQAAELGWCRKREALVATIESPILFQMFFQYYRRNDKGNVLLEERGEHDDMKVGRGRFSGYFSALTPKEILRQAEEADRK